jgi:type VI secretion system protein ImpL
MENVKKKLNRNDIQSLKQCLRLHSSDDPLILLFQLTDKLTEMEHVVRTKSDIDDSSMFCLYNRHQADFLCVKSDDDLDANMSASFVRQINRFIYKNNKKKSPEVISLVVDARNLKISETKDLFNNGRMIRSWIDTIRNATFRNIPVVLLIRNAEDLDGFVDWSQELEEHHLDEAFGFALPDEEIEAQSFTTAAFREIHAQLSKQDKSEKNRDSSHNRLSQSLTSIKPNLLSLINGIIQTQPDLTPPRFIGFYLMGMVHRPVPLMNENSIDLEIDNKPDTIHSSELSIQTPAFVKDIFENIFLKAGSYVHPFQAESSHVGLYKIISLSIILFIIASSVFMFMAYQSHMEMLKNTQKDISMLQKTITTPMDAIPYFNSLKKHIVMLENEIQEWWLPWLGFSKEIESLNHMKYNYVLTFRKYLLKPLIDQYMLNVRNHMSKRSATDLSDQKFHQKTGQYMSTLAFYVEHLNRFFSSLEVLPFIFEIREYSNGKDIFDRPLSNDRMHHFLICYDQALRWTKNQREFRKDFHLFQTTIQEMVVLMPTLNEWIIPIVNDHLIGLFLTDLWHIQSTENIPNAYVPAAFTGRGYQFIHQFFHIIRKSHTHPGTFDDRLHPFYETYQKDYIQIWEQAAMHFSSLTDHLDGRDHWADLIGSIGNITQNPYFQMIRLIVENTQPFDDHQKEWPEWLNDCHRLYKHTEIEKNASSETLTKKTNKTELVEKTNEINTIYKEYLNALNNISTFPNTPERSYKLIKTLFSSPGQFCPGDGPDTIACLSIFQLQSMWNKKNEANEAFWTLYEGPMDFIRKFCLNETACQLQHHWDEKILSAEAQGAPAELAMLQKSNALQFVKTIGKPFLEKITPTRYVPKRLSGLILPFKESFFQYVAYHPGVIKKLKNQYPVIIKATPSRTNTNAEYLPQLTMIKMKCGTNQQILVIGHHPAQETFHWSESCGPVHIIFHLKEMKLIRTYPNPMAFPKFLRDVRYGSKRFHRSDFVLNNARLALMGIEYIELRLQLFGHEPLLNAQKRGFMAPPEQITYCWEKDPQKTDLSKEPIQKNEPKNRITPSEPKNSIQDDNDISDLPKKQTDKKALTIAPEKEVYIIIIASFRNDTNAINKARRLTKEGLESKVYWLKDQNETPWYIVVSGMYPEQEQANEKINLIRKKYNIAPFMKKMKKKIIDERQVQMNF